MTKEQAYIAHLLFKNKVLESDGNSFEAFFTTVMSMANPGFQQGGTFDSDIPGTFESATGGTFNPLLSHGSLMSSAFPKCNVCSNRGNTRPAPYTLYMRSY